MNPSDIVITVLPQADGQLKPRPVLVLKKVPPFGDLLICAVSTQLQQFHAELDELIEPRDADFRTSGLKAASVIRTGQVAAYAPSRINGRIGSISKARLSRLLTKLSDFLDPSI